MTEEKSLSCIQCGKEDSQVPLIKFQYQGVEYQVCTEHLPALLHNPRSLSGKLPNAETLPPAKGH